MCAELEILSGSNKLMVTYTYKKAKIKVIFDKALN